MAKTLRRRPPITLKTRLAQIQEALNGSSFFLKPLGPFRLDLTVWALRRRPDNRIDRWDGESYRRVLLAAGGPIEVVVQQLGPFESPRLRVAIQGARVTDRLKNAVRADLDRLLGLQINLYNFYQLAATDSKLGPLAMRFRGLKPPRFPTLFETLSNAIACQVYFHMLLDRLDQAGLLVDSPKRQDHSGLDHLQHPFFSTH